LLGRLPTDSIRYNNINRRTRLSLDRELLLKEAEHCPSDGDPFLPWIHDVIPVSDGSKISFVAQNKRMCNTANNFANDLRRLEPQIALLQPISVKRVTDGDDDAVRYKLTSREDADEDGKETRFICIFHGTGEYADVYYETLSVYPFNYEMVSMRKLERTMISREGQDKGQFWLSTMLFECPVPIPLQDVVKDGSSLKNGKPSLFIDIVPIRTPTRFRSWYLSEDQVGPIDDKDYVFDAEKAFKNSDLLPKIKDSGRLENMPICKPALELKDVKPQKKHNLIACLWASASYTTRGSTDVVGDGEQRLKEWVLHHKEVGVDHFYVYDNTGAHDRHVTKTLKQVTDLFPDDVTWINWPMKVCNNAKPKAWNPGERSSQYAAEASCRLRFGPGAEWLASIDTDEYLFPTGEHENFRTVLQNARKGGANILSFRSSRAYPRKELMM